MLALDKLVPINNHRIVLEYSALPAYSSHARVIVMLNAVSKSARRVPPLVLAGKKATLSVVEQRMIGKC